MNSSINFGKALREWVAAKRIPISELSASVGLNRRTISRLLNKPDVRLSVLPKFNAFMGDEFILSLFPSLAKKFADQAEENASLREQLQKAEQERDLAQRDYKLLREFSTQSTR
jgi:transcriptional regulator with XRE-family HTH domain